MSDYALALSSDTLVGTTLAFAGLASGTTPSQASGTLNYWTFTIGGIATSPEQTIENTSAPWQSAIGSDGATVFLFDAATPR